MNIGRFLSLIAFFVLVSTCVRADTLPESVLLPSASPAVSDDAMAIVFNPAGLGVRRGATTYYLHTTGESGGDNAFFMSSAGFGFGAEFLGQGPVRFRKYTLSDGIKLFDGLYLGSSYARFDSASEAYDKLSSWDAGLLLRPSRYLSIGLVGRNLNRPMFNGTRTSRVCDLSLAFRPFTNRITFSANSSLEEGHRLRDANISWAVDIEPIDGMLFRGSYNNDGSFDFKIGMGLPQFEIGSYSRFDSNRKRDGGAIYAMFSAERRRSEFQIGRYVLEVSAEDIDQIQTAKDDKTIEGIILKPKLSGYNMGEVQEMRDTVLDFRSSGKKAICYMELAGNKEYYLASAGDKILFNPAGYLSLNGLRSEVTSYKGTLDKLGIDAELFSIGKYKSAAERLTNESMSDAHRESLSSLLDDLHDQMLSGIAEGRSVSRAKAQEWIDKGPYTAKEAFSAGLVDKLIYEDQLEEVCGEILGRKVKKLSANLYSRRGYYNYDWGIKPKIAIIYAEGMMLPGKSFPITLPFPLGKVQKQILSLLSIPRIMGSDTITSAIKSAREDESIKAVVLRIDSEGGSVFAGELIWREVMLTKKKKPVIVSMSGIAASGGYYIACPADAVVAEPGTITGSIGVIAGKLNMRGLYDKLGIKKEILKRGKNSDIYTEYSGFTEEQKEIVDRQMREIYQDFVRKVAQGRNMEEKEVELIAQGRAWTGRQAKDNGLVDELGGLQIALSIAQKKANLKKGEIPDIVILPKRIPLWRYLISEKPSVLYDTSNFLDSVKERIISESILFLMPYMVNYE